MNRVEEGKKAEVYVYDHKQPATDIARLTSLVWHRQQQFKPWWERGIPFSNHSEYPVEICSIISEEGRLFIRGISEELVDFVLHYPRNI